MSDTPPPSTWASSAGGSQYLDRTLDFVGFAAAQCPDDWDRARLASGFEIREALRLSAIVSVMIHPKVHLRIPCHELYDLYPGELAHLLGAPRVDREAGPRVQSKELIDWSDGRSIHRVGV